MILKFPTLFLITDQLSWIYLKKNLKKLPYNKKKISQYSIDKETIKNDQK